jgi:WD40 repeat protein
LQLLQYNSVPISFNISPKGKYLAVMLKDKAIRIFNIKTGKLIHIINESIKDITKIQEDLNHPNHI